MKEGKMMLNFFKAFSERTLNFHYNPANVRNEGHSSSNSYNFYLEHFLIPRFVSDKIDLFIINSSLCIHIIINQKKCLNHKKYVLDIQYVVKSIFRKHWKLFEFFIIYNYLLRNLIWSSTANRVRSKVRCDLSRRICTELWVSKFNFLGEKAKHCIKEL